MKFEVLALDYDGTIARDGVLAPDVKAAIVEARDRGIVVILVTGRILSELKRVAGGIEFVDGVVAENGAVLALPSGPTRRYGSPPPQAFLDELRRRRIEFAGRKVLSAEASVEIAEHATDDPLTPAELRVLRLIAEGKANKEIAAQLSVSEETVKGQVRNILSKLGANDRTHAAMIGVARGMVEL